MGGHALKKLGITTKRIPPFQYRELEAEAKAIITQYFDHVDTPRQLDTKADFGDVDFVVCSPKRGVSFEDLRTFLSRDFQTKGFVTNGNVTSFEFKDFQCDLIIFPSRAQQQAAVAFFSWADLGMMLGVIARTLGLSFGMTGLDLRIVLPEKLVKSSSVTKLQLTGSLEEAFAFLGYDVNKWKQGFRDEQDIIQYVLHGEHVGADVLKILNRNVGKRSTNRPMFKSFLEHAALRQASLEDLPEEEEDKRILHRERALEHFGMRANYLQEVLSELLQPKYRGMLQMEAFRQETGLQSKDLGAFISLWRNSKTAAEIISAEVRMDFRNMLNEAEAVLRTSPSEDDDAVCDVVWSKMTPWQRWVLTTGNHQLVYADMLSYFRRIRIN